MKLKINESLDGKGGVGYILRKEHDRPPIMLDLGDLKSLVIGAKTASSLDGYIKQTVDIPKINLNV